MKPTIRSLLPALAAAVSGSRWQQLHGAPPAAKLALAPPAEAKH